mgnify:FL=1
MVAINQAYAPSETDLQPQNRVGRFFDRTQPRAWRSQPLSPTATKEKTVTVTILVSGRPFWPKGTHRWGKLPMRLFLAILSLSAVIFTACAMETGRVIELNLSPSADQAAIEDALQTVASEMGMDVERLEGGPGEIVEYRASLSKESSPVDFYISIVIGDRRSVLTRTLNTRVVDPALAERAFELFAKEFRKREMKYDLRRG